jgi:LysR family glycine cleavage system transcriptional activator
MDIAVLFNQPVNAHGHCIRSRTECERCELLNAVFAVGGDPVSVLQGGHDIFPVSRCPEFKSEGVALCKPVLLKLGVEKLWVKMMAVSPPRPRGPHLNALRAFEAAARLGGFAAAADELSVTPGAVAQHIKALEAWVGAPLFERKSQGVCLSRLGENAAVDLGPAFDRIGEAVLKMRSLAPETEIRIATLPSIAQFWLSPRLPKIRSAVPEATVSIIATEKPPNLLREPIDLALFFESDIGQPNTLAIAQDVIFPVCAPSLAAGFRTIDDLSGACFLHDTTWSDDWELWLRAVGQGGHVETRGPTYSLYALAVEEAKNASGILIGHEALVRPLLDAGSLVSLFDQPVVLDRHLCLTSARSLDGNAILQQLVEVISGDFL